LIDLLFLLQAWGRTSGGSDAGILFLSDSNAELSRALGLAIESDVMVRTKRFSLIADDGVVTHYFSSANESSDTWAPNVLAKL
jgi:peroxiredoxin